MVWINDNIGRALVAVLETSRGHTTLAAYRDACATRIGSILGRRTLVGTLDAYGESILVADSDQRQFELSFNANTPLGEVTRLDPHSDETGVTDGRTVAVSAVLGERVGAFIGFAVEDNEELEGRALVDLAYQVTLAMEVILERAEAYREADVMAQEARSKSELLATVSHEIRTPLNALINLPERVRREFDASLEGRDAFSGNVDVVLRALQMLERSGQHILKLVNDILDVSRIDAGEMPLRPEEAPVRGILEHVASSCAPLADARGVEMTLSVDDSCGSILCDPVRVTQILLNLATNGVKYSSSPGSVRLVAEDLGESVLFSVKDHGIGISLKDQDRIFERYIQLQPADGPDQGYGLGLHITRKLVELHEGSIWLESELGHGATFFVKLPRRARALELLLRRAEEPADIVSRAGDDHTILLVDDDATVLETAELLLEELGHSLISTTDVRRIDQLITDHRPSLIVLDVAMDGVNGIDVLTRLREEYSPAELPVLVSSGQPLEPRDLEALGAGWLPKPWRRVELLDAVTRGLRG